MLLKFEVESNRSISMPEPVDYIFSANWFKSAFYDFERVEDVGTFIVSSKC